MVRRTDPKDDEWENVKDAKKRKQIQDRLAQRARRQRLREAKINATNKHHYNSKVLISRRCNCGSSTDFHSHSSQQLALAAPELDPISSIALFPFDATVLELSDATGSKDLPDLDFGISGISDSGNERTEMTILSPISQPHIPMTVFSALYINGTILGLTCSNCLSSLSPHPSPSHPLPLHPTEAQLMNVHPRWYDRLPFPRMRDSLIKLMGVIDEEKLLKDLFTMPSWSIETEGRRGGGWESACWDPRAWKMEKDWAVKWGWLMF